jgi:protein-L-isoaspartate(D-aspartate) O-methyltransferase
MVQRLHARGIGDARVLDAMRQVPRERFVPRYVARAAYRDNPLPIGLDQTISAPLVVAWSAAALQAGPDAHVLEIGTGSGYGAAVLSRCHRSVVTIERHPELADRAATVLAALGYDNVEVRTGDGTLGAPDRAPFDGIVVTAMAEDEPPRALLDQLAPDAALVCPVGHRGHGTLVRYRGGRTEELGAVAFVPLVTGGAM